MTTTPRTMRAILQRTPVMPILTIHHAQWAGDLAQALVQGGITVFEVVMRTPQSVAALRAMLEGLEATGVIIASPEVIDGMARLMTTGIGFHALQLELEGDPGPPRARVARAAAQIMLLPAGLMRRA